MLHVRAAQYSLKCDQCRLQILSQVSTPVSTEVFVCHEQRAILQRQATATTGYRHDPSGWDPDFRRDEYADIADGCHLNLYTQARWKNSMLNMASNRAFDEHHTKHVYENKHDNVSRYNSYWQRLNSEEFHLECVTRVLAESGIETAAPLVEVSTLRTPGNTFRIPVLHPKGSSEMVEASA